VFVSMTMLVDRQDIGGDGRLLRRVRDDDDEPMSSPLRTGKEERGWKGDEADAYLRCPASIGDVTAMMAMDVSGFA
jgi:hypothetical protein